MECTSIAQEEEEDEEEKYMVCLKAPDQMAINIII